LALCEVVPVNAYIHTAQESERRESLGKTDNGFHLQLVSLTDREILTKTVFDQAPGAAPAGQQIYRT